MQKSRTGRIAVGIMFQNPGSHLCPVASLEKYLSKIPSDATAFYLHPKKMVITSDSIWYSQEPMGFNYLSSMLPRLCQEAGTLEKYTNNCFRSLREIMSVSRLIVPWKVIENHQWTTERDVKYAQCESRQWHTSVLLPTSNIVLVLYTNRELAKMHTVLTICIWTLKLRFTFFCSIFQHFHQQVVLYWKLFNHNHPFRKCKV